MDLELTHRETWLASSWRPCWRATDGDRERLVELGRAGHRRGGEGRAVQLCVIATRVGAHLASMPFIGSAAPRYAAPSVLGADGRASRSRWSSRAATGAGRRRGGAVAARRAGEVAVEHGGAVDRLAVAALSTASPRACSRCRRRQSTQQPARRDRAVGPIDWTLAVTPRPSSVATSGRARAARLARRRAARRRGVGRCGRAPCSTSPRLRRRAPPVRPHDRQLTRRCATCSPTCTSVRQLWSTVLYAAAALDDASTTRSRPRRSRRPTSHAPRARSPTARCRCSAASPSPRARGASLPAPDRRRASSSSAMPRTTSASSAAARGAAPPTARSVGAR